VKEKIIIQFLVTNTYSYRAVFVCAVRNTLSANNYKGAEFAEYNLTPGWHIIRDKNFVNLIKLLL
jgi:hypothetical protein